MGQERGTQKCVLCTKNGKEQMAEGLLSTRQRRFEVQCGMRVGRRSPYAVEVMDEVGIDITTVPKVEDYMGKMGSNTHIVCAATRRTAQDLTGVGQARLDFEDPRERRWPEEGDWKKSTIATDELKTRMDRAQPRRS